MDKELDQETLRAVKEEVTESFTSEEIHELGSFEEFFKEVDIQNAYEEEWEPKKYKPYYLQVYKELTNK
jgi:hypothetical protein